MRPRQDLIDLFSAFAQFEGDRFRSWVQDARLRRSMQRSVSTFASSPQSAPESYWALYWHQHWRQTTDKVPSLALGYLSAYLQESCYWAAERIVRKLSDPQYPLSDCFQMAIANVQTVLKRFKPDRGASLKTFANLVFPSLLAEQLRQVGLSPNEIAQYQLAWVCFNALYVPEQTGTKPLPDVNADLWLQITTLYNTECRSQFSGASSDCTPA